MKKTHFIASIIVFIICIFTSLSIAQSKSSLYSIFGVGQIIDNSYGTNKSLGGVGIAFQSGRTINLLNPASYLGTRANSILMETGVYALYNSATYNGGSQSEANINFSYFSTNFYFAEWWAFNFGIYPYSYIDYNLTLDANIGGELTTYKVYFERSGGLHRINFGNSFNITDGLNVGFNTSFIFGLITETEKALGSSSSTGYEINRERKLNGIYFDYGIQYSLNVENWLYTIGIIYCADKVLNSNNVSELTYNETTGSINDDQSFNSKIPKKFGLGIALKKDKNFRVGLDYDWRNWSDVDLDNSKFKLRDSHRFSFGVEYTPGDNDSWLQTLYYQFGINYCNSYLEIENNPINSLAINLGLGIPYLKIHTFTMALEYGLEGTKDNGLVKNSYWLLNFNFSLQEFLATDLSKD